mmetsp:Transcript_11780/g.29760  ORF Transcript_11780/g.29760 Transcript_11780/m.29760 type:complete len:237 (-) Transcript_11780:229-939(-)
MKRQYRTKFRSAPRLWNATTIFSLRCWKRSSTRPFFIASSVRRDLMSSSASTFMFSSASSPAAGEGGALETTASFSSFSTSFSPSVPSRRSFSFSRVAFISLLSCICALRLSRASSIFFSTRESTSRRITSDISASSTRRASRASLNFSGRRGYPQDDRDLVVSPSPTTLEYAFSTSRQLRAVTLRRALRDGWFGSATSSKRMWISVQSTSVLSVWARAQTKSSNEKGHSCRVREN